MRRLPLIELRALLDLRQSDVAEQSGGEGERLGMTEICRIETGQNRLTRKLTIERAARGYGLSVESFERLCRGDLTVGQAAGIVRRAAKRR